MTTGVLAVTSIPVGDHITTRVLGLTINIDDVIATIIAGLVVIGLGLLVRANLTAGVPGRLQLGFEAIVNGVSRQVETSMGEEGRSVIPLALSIFLVILFANWLELIPSGHNPQYLPAPTGDINLVAAMAILVIVAVHVTWIRRQGLRRYLRHYTQPYPLLTLFNVIEEVTKPITLALRLFGNIFAGGLMLVLIADLLPVKWIIPIPILDVVWKLFDGFFVGPIQAFIFALLTILYFQSAIDGGH